MSKKIMRLMSLLLALCMVVSLVSCKKTEKPPADKTSSTSSVADDTVDSSVPDDVVSEITDAIEDGEDDPYDEIGDIGEGSANVVRPETDDAISVGIKLAYIPSEEKDPLEEEIIEGIEDEEEDWVVEEDIVDDFTYELLIQPYGTLSVDGNKRTVEIDNSKDGILFTNYSAISTNVYPTMSALASQQMYNVREAFLEVDADRFNNTKPRFARSWFQIDWMMTNECAEKGLNYKDYANNWEANPDYVNYYNGVYDFNNEYMQSCIDYWSILEEAGTEVYLAFGWKIANRIQNWFPSDMRYAREGAPRDLDAYADAAVALYKYVREDVGLTNFNILSFYNEVNWNAPGENTFQDFSVTGDKRVWWMNMIKKCREALDKNGLEDVQIAGCDHVGYVMSNDEKYVSVYTKNKIPEIIDMWTFHIYPDSGWLYIDGVDTGFKVLCQAMRYLSCLYGENSYITEYYGTVRHDSGNIYAWEKYGWQGSHAAFVISSANNGVRGNFHWGFTGGWLGDPMNMQPADGTAACWRVPRNEESVSNVQHAFYEVSLLNNYIPDDANVHNINWSGEDIRASAFTSPDGEDFTLVVEANEKTDSKKLEVKLTESLSGRDINVFYYDWNIEYTSNAIIPTLYKTIKNVETSFSYDEIDGDYGIYVFTTLDPVKQIGLYNPTDPSKDAIYNYVTVGGEVSIKPQFIDFGETPSDSNVIWEIKRYSCVPEGENVNPKTAEKSVNLHEITDDLGDLTVAADGTVTYKALSTAKSGDIIALRCSLKSDKSVFTTAIIQVKNS